MKEHSNRQRQRQGYKEAETGGEKRDREESKNTLAHTSPPLSKIKTMYKPRRPARTQGRMASSFSLSLPPSRSLLSLFLFAFGQQRDHQPVGSRQKPTIPPENGRKKVGKKTDKPRGHAHTKVYCQQMVRCTISQWSLSQFGKHTLCVCSSVVVRCRTLKRAKRMQANGK